MRATSKILIGAGVLLLGASLFWWKTARSRRQTETALASLLIQRIALQAEARETRERATDLERTRVDLARGLEKFTAAKSKPAEAEAKKPVRPPSITGLIANNPQAEVMMLRWQREAALLEYGSFFRTQGISAEQIRRFQDNWAKHVENDIDLGAVERMKNGPEEKEAAALRQREQDTYEAAQAEVLGAENYRALQEFNRTAGVRNVVVVGLAGAAALQDMPLSAEQGQQLWQAALESAGPGGATAKREPLLAAIDWDALDVRARQILNPAQYALFKTSAAPSGFQSRWKYQLDSAVRRAMESEAVKTEPKTER